MSSQANTAPSQGNDNLAPSQGNDKTSVTAAPKPMATIRSHCALVLDSSLIGGQSLGSGTGIASTFEFHGKGPCNPWVGFAISIPLGSNIEDEGFGQVHHCKSAPPCLALMDMDADHPSVDENYEQGVPKLAQSVTISVRLPRGNFTRSIEPLSADSPWRNRLSGLGKEDALVKVTLSPNAQVDVDGFGMPFSNPGHPSEEWMKKGGTIAPYTCLVGFLESRQFTLVVRCPAQTVEKNWAKHDELPEFRFPYDTSHAWSRDAYRSLLDRNKGVGFPPSWTLDDDNASITVMAHSVAQDIVWLDVAADEIRELNFPGYFVPTIKDEAPSAAKRYFAVVSLTPEFRASFDAAWRRLTKSETLTLNISDGPDDEPAQWDARIMDHPEGIDALTAHPVETHELVLQVRRPQEKDKKRRPEFQVVTFETRQSANAARKESSDR